MPSTCPRAILAKQPPRAAQRNGDAANMPITRLDEQAAAAFRNIEPPKLRDDVRAVRFPAFYAQLIVRRIVVEMLGDSCLADEWPAIRDAFKIEYGILGEQCKKAAEVARAHARVVERDTALEQLGRLVVSC